MRVCVRVRGCAPIEEVLGWRQAVVLRETFVSGRWRGKRDKGTGAEIDGEIWRLIDRGRSASSFVGGES